MARGKQEVMWDHTCSIAATIMNQHRTRGFVTSAQLHPTRRHQRQQGLGFSPETVRAIGNALKERERMQSNV